MGFWVVFVILGFLIGISIGYGAFYFMYENAKLIDELRKNFHKTKQELESAEETLKSLMEENKIIRDQAKKLIIENDDLQKIVSELSIYSLHIKQGGEKAKELANILGIYNKEIEEKIEKVLGKDFAKHGSAAPQTGAVTIGWNKSADHH